MRRWWLVIALLLSLGVNVGILATLAVQRARRPPPLAWEQPEGPPRGIRRGLDRLADALGLEGEKRQRFLEVQRQFFLGVAQHRRELRRLHQELRRELTAAEPDEPRIRQLVADLGRTYAGFEELTAGAILESRRLLDDEQSRRYLQLLGRLRSQARELPPGRRPGPFARQRGEGRY